MPRSASPTIPNESQLSRKDIELLSKIAGGQEALIAQVNTLQLSAEAGREAQRKQSEDQRAEHNEQMKALTTKIETLELWRITTITPERIINWDAAANRVEDHLSDKVVERRDRVFEWSERLQDRWKFLFGLLSVVFGVISFMLYWVIGNVILPMLTRKGL